MRSFNICLNIFRIFPPFMCKLVPFLATLTTNVSIFTLIAISCDRYKAVLYPFTKKTSVHQCFLSIVLIWTLSCFLSVMKLFNFRTELVDKSTDDLRCGPVNMIINRYESYVLVVVQYLAPSILISFVYARIGFHFWKVPIPQIRKSLQTMKRKKHVNTSFVIFKEWQS